MKGIHPFRATSVAGIRFIDKEEPRIEATVKSHESVARQFFYGKERNPKPNFGELIKRYSLWELQSPGRSTVFLLAYWSRDSALEEFGEAIGYEFRQPVRLNFEYPVSVKAGKGKASFTDLLISSEECSIAIEAKHSEGPYAKVSDWLIANHRSKSGNPANVNLPARTNRLTVLQGWLDAINETLESGLDINNVGGLTYQLLHRTASACEGKSAFKAVVYQCFDPTDEHRKYYRQELRTLRDLIGSNAPIKLVYLECRSTRTRDYQNLLTEWEVLKPYAKRLYQLRSSIDSGLRTEALLGFEPGSCVAVPLG